MRNKLCSRLFADKAQSLFRCKGKQAKPALLGMLFVVASSALYGLSPLIVTSLTDCGAHYSNIMFYKGAPAAVELAVISLMTHQRIRLTRIENRSMILVSFFRAATCFFLFGSYEWLATGLATSIHFTFPAFVTLLCLVLFRERIGHSEGISLLMAMSGIALFVWNADNSRASVTGIVFGILSALLYGVYLVALKKCPINDVPPPVFAMYEMAYAAVFALISSLIIGQMHFALTKEGWIVAAIGATLTAICAILMKAGVARISAQQASILCVLEPIVSVLAGVLILHEIISIKVAIGSALVIGATLVTCFQSKCAPDAKAEDN